MAKARSSARAESALSASLRRGYTLPAEWYTDPAIFRAERARLFRRAWQFAGYRESLAERGSFISVRVGETPLVLTHRSGWAVPCVRQCVPPSRLGAGSGAQRATADAPVRVPRLDV